MVIVKFFIVTFSLAQDDNGEYALSASGTDWLVDQCGNYAAADPSTPRCRCLFYS